MRDALWGDAAGDLIPGVSNWVTVGGTIVTVIVIPFFKEVVIRWFDQRTKAQVEVKKLDHELTADEREQARKDKAADERILSRRIDDLFARHEENERQCREDTEELRRQIRELYRHIMIRETLVGRWMSKVAGWIRYAGTLFEMHKIEYKPFTDEPPEMPELPTHEPPAGQEDVG